MHQGAGVHQGFSRLHPENRLWTAILEALEAPDLPPLHECTKEWRGGGPHQFQNPICSPEVLNPVLKKRRENAPFPTSEGKGDKSH